MIEPDIDHCGTPERISHMLQVISQPAFTCSKLTIEQNNKVWNMFKVNNKDTIVNFEQ